MSEALRIAAIELYGFYNNGAGVKRPLAAHEALDGIDNEEYGVAIDGISATIQAAYQASESLKGYKAFLAVSEAAHSALETSPFNSGQIARVALSEISAEWIVNASPTPDQVTALANLVMKSRPVAREFLELFLWDDALDID